MPRQILEEVKSKKNYYRDRFHFAVRALFICTFIIASLIIANFVMVMLPASVSSYATSSDGSLIQIFPAKWGSRIVQPDQLNPIDANATKPS